MLPKVRDKGKSHCHTDIIFTLVAIIDWHSNLTTSRTYRIPELFKQLIDLFVTKLHVDGLQGEHRDGLRIVIGVMNFQNDSDWLNFCDEYVLCTVEG